MVGTKIEGGIVGRISQRVPCYYYRSKSTGKRVSWCFPNRKSAQKWLDWECHVYTFHGSLEEWLAKPKGGSKENHIKAWKNAKFKWEDYELKRGVFLTTPEKMWHHEKGKGWH